MKNGFMLGLGLGSIATALYLNSDQGKKMLKKWMK